VDVIAPLLVILVLGIVVLIVAAPLRANRARRAADPDEARRADLEAAKEDKYREIRDAEMDFRTGKLSEADWRRLDRELRAEAVELLRRVDELGPPA
jgi:flagellar biosynthesis/type III secretory pathway M-ring protein FliF/YscJ